MRVRSVRPFCESESGRPICEAESGRLRGRSDSTRRRSACGRENQRDWPEDRTALPRVRSAPQPHRSDSPGWLRQITWRMWEAEGQVGGRGGRPRWEAELLWLAQTDHMTNVGGRGASGRPRWETEVGGRAPLIGSDRSLSQSGELGLPLSASHLGLPPRPPTFVMKIC